MHLTVGGSKLGEAYAFKTPGTRPRPLYTDCLTPPKLISHCPVLLFPHICLSQVTVCSPVSQQFDSHTLLTIPPFLEEASCFPDLRSFFSPLCLANSYTSFMANTNLSSFHISFTPPSLTSCGLSQHPGHSCLQVSISNIPLGRAPGLYFCLFVFCVFGLFGRVRSHAGS